MKTFEFSIIASGLDPSADDFEARFYDNGCDDALVSFQKGHIIIDFAREADCIVDAMLSAMINVADSGAKIERVEPDPLVSLADIARRSGMTRGAITQYAKGQRGANFPAPVMRVTSDSPLWEWASVAHWFVQKRKLSIEVAIEAEIMREINANLAHIASHGAVSSLDLKNRLSRHAIGLKERLRRPLSA